MGNNQNYRFGHLPFKLFTCTWIYICLVAALNLGPPPPYETLTTFREKIIWDTLNIFSYISYTCSSIPIHVWHFAYI